MLLPLFSSRVSAGFPSPADDYLEGDLDLNEYLIRTPPATFLVRVSGNSMIGKGIYDGDLLVVDRSLEPLDRDVVVAVVEGELTVKQLRFQDKEVWLMPANRRYKPLCVTGMDLQIWGVVSSSIHHFRKRVE